MATTTPNLGLTLPVGTEQVSRQIINGNMQAIDDAFANIKNQFNTLTKVSSNISEVERAGYVRYGNVVIVFLTFTVGTAITNSTEILFSGLPKAWYTIRTNFIKTNTTNTMCRIAIDPNGYITNAYTQGGIPTGPWEGTIAYICEEGE